MAAIVFVSDVYFAQSEEKERHITKKTTPILWAMQELSNRVENEGIGVLFGFRSWSGGPSIEQITKHFSDEF